MKSLRLSCLLVLATLLLVLGSPAARADTPADRLDVAITVNADGSIDVTEELEFGTAPGEIRRELPLTWDIDGGAYYRYSVSDASATLPGGEAVGFQESGDALTLNATLDQPGTLQSSYRVVGATSAQTGQDGALSGMTWPALYGLSVGVKQVQVTVTGPAPQMMDCVAGPLASIGNCAAISGGTVETPNPVFQDGPREALDEVVVTVGYDPADVSADADLQHRWSLDRAFEVSWPTVAWALAAALIGAALLYALFRRTGRDLAGNEPTLVAGFTPIGDGESTFEVRDAIRPGHVGTVADERVDPLDITATLLDLAVRGHLLITELPRAQHGLLDWTLQRREGRDELARFEQELLDVVTPAGEPTLVSQLPASLSAGIGRVQDALYEDVVTRGWFESRPDSTRSSWRVRGWVALGVAVVAAVLLVAFTNLGLLALVLLAIAAGLVWIADRMPRRTAAGSALLRGLEALSAVLAIQPTDHLPKGRELPEVSRLLGYTVVLGSKERWIEALVAADDDVEAPDPDALDWYHAPDTWHLQDLPASLTQFVHTVQGELFAR